MVLETKKEERRTKEAKTRNEPSESASRLEFAIRGAVEERPRARRHDARATPGPEKGESPLVESCSSEPRVLRLDERVEGGGGSRTK